MSRSVEKRKGTPSSRSPPKRANDYSKIDKFAQDFEDDIYKFVTKYLIDDYRIFEEEAIDDIVMSVMADLKKQISPDKIVLQRSVFPKWFNKRNVDLDDMDKPINELKKLIKTHSLNYIVKKYDNESPKGKHFSDDEEDDYSSSGISSSDSEAEE